MIDPITTDILIPVYKNIDQISSLVSSLKEQVSVKINKIVCPLTLSHEEVDDKIKHFFDDNNVTYFDVDQSEFSHSLTREKAIKEYCESDIVVLMSQDVILNKNDSIYQLIKDINNKKCIYAYGKQICPKRSLEKFIRQKNYPNESYFVSKDDIERMQIMAFFASDAFSALDRNEFISLGGYQGYDIMMSEDMLYSYFVLQAGKIKKYCAEAEVIHWHKYKIKQLYRRYYDTGVFYNKVKLFDGYKSTNSGFKLAMYTLGQCFKHFYIPGLFRWLPDMAARYLGMKKGRKVKEDK